LREIAVTMPGTSTWSPTIGEVWPAPWTSWMRAGVPG
jgi:hypothetical protein